MKFFIPHATNEPEAERVYASVVKFAESNSVQIPGLPDRVLPRRIYRLDYRHNGKTYAATVGQPEGRTGEEVIAILEGPVTYLIFTVNHGAARGEGIMVGTNEVTYIEDFEAE